MTKSGEDFKQAAYKKRPNKWVIRECSLCDYPLGYVFNQYHSEVAYDSGCNCVKYTNFQAREWDDLARMYNSQTNAEYIKEMKSFWGFDE